MAADRESWLKRKLRLKRKVARERLQRVYVGQLRRLARKRFGRHLPDDEDGQAFLRALAMAGISGPDALKIAPWLLPDRLAELDYIFGNVGPIDFSALAGQLGWIVRLTDTERTECGVFALRPHDVAWAVIQERRRQAHVARNSERNRQIREKARALKQAVGAAGDLDEREERIFALLTSEFVRVPALVRAIAETSPWAGQNGRPLTGNSLAQAVHRAVRKLRDRGLAGVEEREGPKGGRSTECWIRRLNPIHDHDSKLLLPAESKKAPQDATQNHDSTTLRAAAESVAQRYIALRNPARVGSLALRRVR